MDFQNSFKTGKSTNLIKLHKEALDNILKTSQREEESDECVWKILLFDTFCQNMLSTVLKVGHLRELNITLHLHLFQKGEKREKLHGVKAYYLIQPTQENIEQIKDDFSKDLYDQVYINFSSFAPEALLQDLAVHVGKMNAVYKIKRVVQHSLDFVTMAKDLFTLNITESYAKCHSQNSKILIKEAAMGLFCLFRTTKQVPLVFFKAEDKNSEQLAIELANLFEKYYLNSREFEEEQSDFISQNKSHPLLILNERDSDLGSQLLHPWHYAALVHDIFKIENNKIKIQNNSQNGSQTDGKIYDLDCSGEDSYWSQKMSEPFPDVASDINDRLAKWEQEFKQLMAKKDDATQMVNAMGSINEMQDKKRLIEMHLQISTGIMSELKSRSLDKYFEAEASIIKDKMLHQQEKKDLLGVFEETQANGSPKSDFDKLRVLLIYLLFVNDIDVGEFQKIEASAKIQNKKLLQILEKFIKKRIPNYQASSAAAVAANTSDEIGGLFGKIANSVKSSGKGLLNNMKNQLAGTEQDFEITNSVRTLIETKCIAFEKLGYRFLDILNRENTSSPPQYFSDIVVFTVDGANLNEHQNLQEVFKKLGKSVIYGGSEILNAETFISQIFLS